MLLYTRLAPPKVPKKRSRAGCSYCKEKKKKCDEIRPACARCLERGQECVYEAVRPRQRRKRDSTAPCSPFDTNSSSGSDRATHSIDTQIAAEWNDDAHDKSAGEDSFDESPTTSRPPTLNTSLVNRTAGKQMGDSLEWAPTDLPVISPLDSVEFQLPPFDEPKFDVQHIENEEEDVEEIVRRQSIAINIPTTTYASTYAAAYATPSPSLAMIAPVTAPSPRLEFCSPVFSEFSGRTNRRALVDHFCNVLSHLIVFREESGNPFQQLVLPLCHESQPVTNAVYALASAHLEYRGVDNDEKSVYFHNKAIQGLARLIQKGAGANRNELLAAIMLLVYYEVLVQKGRSNIVDGHLKGAMTIMSNNGTATDPTGIFLERAFRFYDVIAALSFGTAPLSSAPGTNYLAPFPPLDSGGATSPINSVDTLLGMATSLWPVIHRLSNLLALKDQLDVAVANEEASKIAVLRTEFEASATAIESALEDWHPVLPENSVLSQNPEELSPEQSTERSRLQSILSNALSYRHSAFVYLYRTIYNYPRRHPLVQRHAHISLTHCVGTVSNTGPMSALLWPLFVAACEATTLSDRDLARQTFIAINRRQGMTNIDRAWTIVQEVWRRADEEDMLQQQEEAMMMGARSGGDLWRRVSADMGVTIVFG
ncbi:transcriptional regulatory protein pro-1 [Fusarium heterosporum]|uniref:Transcriptional regulatory protein pro-1 n=1 Tax=Fusarium heterosporum TaxID=42747 RepID=A0A8H5X4C5_FUSHE|nr:transcriptional regulatory protein pro-1 [Fusarium heterosporum]